MLYTLKGKYPSTLPHRIRLEDKTTRTQPFSEEVLESLGYRLVEDPPPFGVEQNLDWTGTSWLVTNKTEKELEPEWNKIRDERNEKIKEVEWRYNRFYRHQRLGLPQIDTIENLDRYIQALADVTKQKSPFNIVWPSLDN